MKSAAIHTIRANGLDFSYLEFGPPDGELALLIHGFPDTPHTWSHLAPAMGSAGWHVVAPFTRGYFPTAIPSDGAYDADTLGRDALALIEALTDKPAVVIGHDWGASAAYSAAALRPKLIRRVITAAVPHPATMLPSPRLLWGVRHFFALSTPGAAARIRAGNFTHLDELVARWSSDLWDIPPDETEAVKESLSHEGSLEAAIGYYRALRPWLPPGQRAKVSVPTCSIAGEHDPILKRPAFDRASRQFTAGYEVRSAPGGHFMHREYPEVFTALVLDILADEP